MRVEVFSQHKPLETPITLKFTDEDTVLSVTLTADQSRKLRHDLNIAIGRVEADLNGDAGFIEGLRAVVGLPETE